MADAGRRCTDRTADRIIAHMMRELGTNVRSAPADNHSLGGMMVYLVHYTVTLPNTAPQKCVAGPYHFFIEAFNHLTAIAGYEWVSNTSIEWRP